MKNLHVKQEEFKQETLTGCMVIPPQLGFARGLQPLEMRWQPQEDITTYELAMCLPYLIRQYPVMPYEVDQSLPHFRHFKIIDHNKTYGGDK